MEGISHREAAELLEVARDAPRWLLRNVTTEIGFTFESRGEPGTMRVHVRCCTGRQDERPDGACEISAAVSVTVVSDGALRKVVAVERAAEADVGALNRTVEWQSDDAALSKMTAEAAVDKKTSLRSHDVARTGAPAPEQQQASGATGSMSEDSLASGDTARIKSDDAALSKMTVEAAVDNKTSSRSHDVAKTGAPAPEQQASGANSSKSEDSLATGDTARIKSDDAALSKMTVEVSVGIKTSSRSRAVAKAGAPTPAQLQASGVACAKSEDSLAAGDTARIKSDDAALSKMTVEAAVDNKTSSRSRGVAKAGTSTPAQQQPSGANGSKSEDLRASGEAARIKTDDAALPKKAVDTTPVADKMPARSLAVAKSGASEVGDGNVKATSAEALAARNAAALTRFAQKLRAFIATSGGAEEACLLLLTPWFVEFLVELCDDELRAGNLGALCGAIGTCIIDAGAELTGWQKVATPHSGNICSVKPPTPKFDTARRLLREAIPASYPAAVAVLCAAFDIDVSDCSRRAVAAEEFKYAPYADGGTPFGGAPPTPPRRSSAKVRRTRRRQGTKARAAAKVTTAAPHEAQEQSPAAATVRAIVMILFVLAIAAGLATAFAVSPFGRLVGARKIFAAAEASVRYNPTRPLVIT